MSIVTFDRELFLKKVDKFDITTFMNIYNLTIDQALAEMNFFKQEGLPECFVIMCSSCDQVSVFGSIEEYNQLLKKEIVCEHCNHSEVLTDRHGGLFTFLFNENAQDLSHDANDSLKNKILKSMQE
jgi:hypothetical protein